MNEFTTIYKQTATGATNVWLGQVEGSRTRTISGQLGGKQVTSEWTQCEETNVGRSNFNTAEEQAVIEMRAMYAHKLARDYRTDINDISKFTRFKPMLATKWKDRQNKLVDERLFMQPKLDGIRCVVSIGGMFTREGKVIYGAPHIFSAINEAGIFEEFPDFVFDGELYNHEFKNDFNKIVSIVKKQSPTLAELSRSEEKIQYWVYDTPTPIYGDTFEYRFAQVKDILKKLPASMFVAVDTKSVDYVNIEGVAAQYIEQGYEGAMIRTNDSYENKRSNNLVKYKEFQDEEFRIIDVQEGVGNRAGMAARVVCALPNGKTFASGMIGDVPYCIKFFNERKNHIGKMATIVFQNYTPDGIPRFSKFKAIRFDT